MTTEEIILKEVYMMRKQLGIVQNDLIVLKTEKRLGVAFISTIVTIVVSTVYKFLPGMIK